MADEDKQSGNPIWCLYVIITALLFFGGGIWCAAICKNECRCTSERCCESNRSCPSETPCSCSSGEVDLLSASCEKEEEEERCGDMFPVAFALNVSGWVMFICSLLYSLFYWSYRATKALYGRFLEIFRRRTQPDLSQVELLSLRTTTR